MTEKKNLEIKSITEINDAISTDLAEKVAAELVASSQESLETIIHAASPEQPEAATEADSDSESETELKMVAQEAPRAPRADNLISLIEDPFQLNNIEISEAQQNNEELDLDEPEDTELEMEAESEIEDSQSMLDKMAQAIQGEARKLEDEIAAQETASAEDAEEAQAARLAAQIAEDQALEAEMARQEAEALAQDPELLAALPKQPEADANGDLDLSEMQSCIEALLFMCDKPISLKKLQDLLGPDFSTSVFQEALTLLMDRYKQPHYGIELAQIAGGYQFRTKPGRAALAKKLARVQTQRLSSGGMESLAIVAYKQPVMKEDIDKVRGVDSSYFIRGLLDKKLIRISGRSELPGRPMLYSTTDEFLELFGLKDLQALPPLRELEQMVPGSQSDRPDEEDPRVKEMRKLVGQMKADGSTSLKYDPREDEKILKEIRERVGDIAISTPYLEEQKTLEKAAKMPTSLFPDSQA